MDCRISSGAGNSVPRSWLARARFRTYTPALGGLWGLGSGFRGLGWKAFGVWVNGSGTCEI
eukprot:2340461-Rhodomonas_salina.1